MKCKSVYVLFFVLIIPLFTKAQKTGFTEEELAELDELEKALDDVDSSLFIALIDSILTIENSLHYSQVGLKAGYSNESLSESRENISSESGYYAGATYYHKSGVFSDVLLQWNSQFDPEHYITTASIGYMGIIGLKWSYFLSYEHYFFNTKAESEGIDFDFSDGFNGSLFFISKHFETGFDYAIILGGENLTHKLATSVSGNFNTNKWWIFDKVMVRPSVGLLFGNQEIIYLKIDRNFIRPRDRFSLVSSNSFGLLNIYLVAPVYFKVKNLTLGINYQFNVPQALPNENLSYDHSHVFNASLSYFIKL